MAALPDRLELVLTTIANTVPGCTITRDEKGVTISINDEGARALEEIESFDISWLHEVQTRIRLIRMGEKK